MPILRRAPDDGIVYTDSDTSSEGMAVGRPQSYPWVLAAIRGPVRYPTDSSEDPLIVASALILRSGANEWWFSVPVYVVFCEVLAPGVPH